MKRYISLPTLALVVTFAVACGKKDSASPTGDYSAPVAPVAGTPVNTPAPSLTFPQWCMSVGGFLHEAQGLCEVQIKKMYGTNYNVLWGQWWTTGLQVQANDTVRIVVSGAPKMRIGAELINGAASGSYLAQSAGTVDFTSRNMTSGFQVREVTVKRCYEANGNTPRCP